MKPHEKQLFGFLLASNASRPIGKKQIATIICQVWYPPFVTGLEHFGHEITAIFKLVYRMVMKFNKYVTNILTVTIKLIFVEQKNKDLDFVLSCKAINPIGILIKIAIIINTLAGLYSNALIRSSRPMLIKPLVTPQPIQSKPSKCLIKQKCGSEFIICGRVRENKKIIKIKKV